MLRLNSVRFSARTPAELKRSVLLLYALNGPAFCASLLILGAWRKDPRPLAAAAALIAAGALWLLLRRSPKVYDWLFSVAIVPTVCCGIGFASCGDRGGVYLAVVGAPLAWAAVLFDAPVVLATLATAILTVFVSLSFRLGIPTAAASTLLLSPVAGLVAWVVFGTAYRLRGMVAERNRAEQALQESETRYSNLFESSADAIVAADEKGHFVDANPAALRLLGYGRKELLGLHHEQVIPAHWHQAKRDILQSQVAVRGYSDEYEQEYIRKDGSSVPVSVRTFVHRDSDGRVAGGWSVLRDITERKRVDEALKESETRYRELIESAPVAIAVARSGRFLYVNSKFLEMHRLEATTEVVGLETASLIAPECRAEFSERASRREQGLPAETHYETVAERKDGSLFPVGVSATMVSLADGPAVIGFFEDLTEAKRAEEERDRLRSSLHHAAKMEAVGQLAGGIAHDFNNLLTVILSGAEAMKQHLAKGVPLEFEVAEEVVEAGKRARDLTRQLLGFARRQVIAPVPLDLNTLVRGIEKLLRRVLGEDIELATALQGGLWPVRCDPGQIEQIILNLAVNSRDAMPNGGTLRIDTENVEVDETLTNCHPFMRAGPHVRLSIRDSGQGMSPEVKAHVFEPFFTTKPVGRGTGLGLATVYGIVKQNEGYILVESESGQGTLCTIYLPRTAQAAVPAKPPAQAVAVQGTETVLVVEDDPQVRAVTVRSLRAGGYKVLVASGGREAIEIGLQNGETPHLLITDVVMPGMDGRAVADELRRHHPEMRVLFVSGHAEEAIVKHGVLDPGIEFLPKPFTTASLLARARSVLDAPGQRPLQPTAIRWSDDLATGVRQIDMQHRELLSNAAALGDAVQSGNLLRAADILKYFEWYASEHFETEERFMESSGYPKLQEHRRAHRAFASELDRRKTEYGTTRSLASVMLELSGWLGAWWKNHVLGDDAEMARHLRREGRTDIPR